MDISGISTQFSLQMTNFSSFQWACACICSWLRDSSLIYWSSHRTRSSAADGASASALALNLALAPVPASIRALALALASTRRTRGRRRRLPTCAAVRGTARVWRPSTGAGPGCRACPGSRPAVTRRCSPPGTPSSPRPRSPATTTTSEWPWWKLAARCGAGMGNYRTLVACSPSK